MAYGASQLCITRRRAPGDSRSRPFCTPRNVARSLVVHSHSRLASTDSGPSPNRSLLTVVSIWKIWMPASRSTSPWRQLLRCSSEFSWSHERARGPHGRHVVVVSQRLVARQAGGGRLPTAVHRHQVDVHVDDQVGGRGAGGDLHLLAVAGLADHRHGVGVLGVVVVELAPWGERVVDAVAQAVPQLGLGHAPVQCERRDQVYVVDADLGRDVEHRLDHALADVGSAHLGQRQRDVVERDGELHAREHAGAQRLGVDRRLERVADRPVRVVDAVQGLGRVDDATAVGRQLLQAELLAVMQQHRRGRAVDVDHQAGPGRGPPCGAGTGRTVGRTQRRPFRVGVAGWSGAGAVAAAPGAKAILVAPRRPAAPACTSASSARSRA
jgi:hypothetical protein